MAGTLQAQDRPGSGVRWFPGHQQPPGPPRPAGRLDRLPAREVMELVSWPWGGAGERGGWRRGASGILAWLEAAGGDGWQERWRNSGADADSGWIGSLAVGDTRRPASQREEIQTGLTVLLCCRVVLPGYGFLTDYKAVSLLARARAAISPGLFAQVQQAGLERGMEGRQLAEALNVLAKVVLHTGRDLGEVTAEDLFGIRAWWLGRAGRAINGIHAAWELLAAVGILPAGSTLRAALRAGPRPTAELVDRHRIRFRPVRDLLVRYLDERRPAMDYNSFRTLAGILAGNFWADIERHHPGITSLSIPADVATAWKQRLHYVARPDGTRRPRKNRLQVLMLVRALYLDIGEWALEDPSWAPWAVPGPVRRGDTDGMAKEKRAATAQMHQRTRERLPHLPVLLDTAARHREEQAALLRAATATDIGTAFDRGGVRYRRVVYKSFARGGTQKGRPTVLAENTATGEQHDLTRLEDDAFWAWAVIETLRHTGVRVEELLEITHLALVSYQLPATGETVPLLQVVPSKSNEERLLLVTPELASVLAAVIARIREDGRVPLAARYDHHERTTGAPLPHLFQRRQGWRREVMSARTVQELISATLDRAGLTDQAGTPLRYTPHDFRRMFATEAVTGGLPVHIAARILGHHSLTTTQAYLAVFQDDLVCSYRAFIDRRRALRPAAEYREPTDAEWREFQDHFELRKLELGTCGRPYGTPCAHEHACIRCPMLRVDPRQRRRLAEIITSLAGRITEARANGWAGEAQGLQASLDAARAKMAALARAGQSLAGPADLGIPVIRQGTGR